MASNTFPPEGHVGIGTLNPKVTLDLRGHLHLSDSNQAAVLYFPETGKHPNLYIRSASNPPAKFNDRVFIGSNGRVGIGTINPEAMLDVRGPNGFLIQDGKIGGRLRLVSDGTGQTHAVFGGSGKIYGANSRFNVVSTSNSLWLESKANTPIQLVQGNREVARVSSSGKLGIGYTAPAQELSVKGKAYVSEGLSVGSSNPDGWKLKIEAGGTSKPGLYVRGRTLVNGRLSVGTTKEPGAQAEIWASFSHASSVYTGRGNLLLYNNTNHAKNVGGTLTFGSNFLTSTNHNGFTTRAAIKGGTSLAGNTGAGFLSFSTVPHGWANQNTERMRIDHNGNVGIGLTEPTQRLDVAGVVKARAGVEAEGELKVTQGTTENRAVLTPNYLLFNLEDGPGTSSHAMFSDPRSNRLSFSWKTSQTNGDQLMSLAPESQFLRGNVGINTNNPTDKLEVNGQAKVTGWDAVFKSRNDRVSPRRDFHLIGTYHGWSTEDIFIAGYNHYYPLQNDPNRSYAKKIFFGQQKTMTVDLAGSVGIGTSNPLAKLDVRGNARIYGQTNIYGDLELDGNLRIRDWEIGVPDYVFEPDYPLESLENIDAYVKQHKHLPEIPSEKEFHEKGINLTELSLQLLKKVEELTLHTIRQEKQIKALMNAQTSN